MSAPTTITPALVDGFVGENRSVPEHRLPLNVSPSSLNIDFTDGVLRPRGGLVKRHAAAVWRGGVRVSDTWTGYGGSRAIVVGHNAAYAFAGDFEYELMAQPFFVAATADFKYLVRHSDGDHATTPTEGVSLYLKKVGGLYRWACSVGDTGGSAVEVVHTQQVVSGRVYSLGVRYIASTRSVTIYVNGSGVGGTLPNGYQVYATNFLLGDSTLSDHQMYFVIDELRVWSGSSGSPLRFQVYRELFASEVTGGLVGYWKFTPGVESTDSSATGNGLSLGGAVTNARGLVASPGLLQDLNGLAPVIGGTSVESLLVGTPTDLYLLDLGAADLLHLWHSGVSPATQRWDWTGTQGATVLCNGTAENQRYNPDLGLRPLSYLPPALTTYVVPRTYSAGALTGTYLYLFAFYSSDDGVESDIGLFTTTATPSSQRTTLGSASEPLPSTTQAGVDTLRIYRTVAGGATFRFLADVAIGTASYEDNTTDGNLGDARDPYNGYGEPSRFSFAHNGSVFLGNQAEQASRLVFSEPGTFHAFYSANTVQVGALDGDELTAGLSVNGAALLFKRHSIWQLTGSGPADYGAVPIYHGLGCVAAATVAAGRDRVYFLGDGDVYALSTEGGAPVPLGFFAQRDVFEAITEADFPYCSATWDPVYRRYVLTVRVSGAFVTLVFDESTNAWWRWNIAAGAWLSTHPEGGRSTLFCGWPGHVCEYDTAMLSEGVQVDGAAVVATTGTATGGSTTTLVNSGAAFPTTGNGLAGVTVTVTHADASVERDTVWFNTATTLYLATGLASAVVSGATYQLGAMVRNWRTPSAYLDGDPDADKTVREVQVQFETESAAPAALTVYTQFDGGAPALLSVDPGVRLSKASAEGRGKALAVGLEDEGSATRWAVSGIRAPWQQRRTRPEDVQ